MRKGSSSACRTWRTGQATSEARRRRAAPGSRGSDGTRNDRLDRIFRSAAATFELLFRLFHRVAGLTSRQQEQTFITRRKMPPAVIHAVLIVVTVAARRNEIATVDVITRDVVVV
jgi:hypothetical protein